MIHVYQYVHVIVQHMHEAHHVSVHVSSWQDFGVNPSQDSAAADEEKTVDENW